MPESIAARKALLDGKARHRPKSTRCFPALTLRSDTIERPNNARQPPVEWPLRFGSWAPCEVRPARGGTSFLHPLLRTGAAI
jgi:hypothetical protein